ncbi:MAG: hypothetical protein P4N60_09875 [Verrucomicrobiae bacterium]|nr:hypothetical protein [Verrucomicrobiae bacterium]
MFKALFGKPKAPRDIDTLIRDIADHQKALDYEELFRVLPGLSLFMSLVEAPPDAIPRGIKTEVKAGWNLKARSVHLQGHDLFLLFTSSTHPKIGPHFAGITGRDALEMCNRAPVMGGLLLQSTGTGWVGLDRQKVLYLLSQLTKQ